MADTITAYHSFSSGTKARSSQVNTNFSNYRGTLIPIDPNTAAGAALTYDLGTTEYRWRDTYLRGLNLIGMTTTANLTLTRDNTVIEGAFPFAIGGVEVARLRASQFNLKFGGNTIASFDASATSFYYGGATVCAILPAGLMGVRNTVVSAATSVSFLATATSTDLIALSFTSYGFGVDIRLEGAAGALDGASVNSVSSIMCQNSSTTEIGMALFQILRDGTTITSMGVHAGLALTTTVAVTVGCPPGAIQFRDTPAAGGHTYKIQYRSWGSSGATTALVTARMVRMRLTEG